MRSRFTFTIAGTVLATCIFAVSAFARSHKVMNGTWTLVPDRSDFGGEPAIQHGTVTINEREGNITVTRNFSYEGGNESYFYRATTDGANNAKIHGAGGVTSKTAWDHDQLRVTTTQGGETTVETYELARDGSLLVHVQGPDRRPITLVFERQ